MLAVILAGGVFEKAGVQLDADQQAGMTAVVAQAAEIFALDEKRANAWSSWARRGVHVLGLSLPVALVVHWQLSVLWVPLFFVAQYVGFVVCVWSLLAAFGSGGKLHVGPVVAVVVLCASLASTVYAVTSTFPGTWAALLLSAAAWPTWIAISLVYTALAPAVEATVPGLRLHPDPLAAVVCHLLVALWRLSCDTDYRLGGGPPDNWPSGPIWPLRRRQSIAAPLEQAARTVEREFVRAAQPVPASAAAQGALGDCAHRVAAWLRARQVQILTPSPVAPANVERELARGLAGVCLGDWSAVQQEPLPPSPGSRLRRALPRLITAAGLVGAAAITPEVFGDVMDPTGVRTLQVALAVTAVGALITPQQAVTDAIAHIQARLPKGP